ncbi:MAG: ATP-binding protein [Gammaproteobacteria bacterium]|nr:ATP-binding protein [Gammaproteobacteria bacterium]
MSFTFEARTLLELGKELISNDEVALYELIKNGIDAHSPAVEILINCGLTHTDYREALRQLRETEKSLAEVTTFLRGKMISSDNPDHETFLSGLDRINDRTKYKKALDGFYALSNSVVIKDTGEGMSIDDLENIYMRIGTRHRRQQNESGETKLGDKGIGRLSAMRLGDMLRVETTKSGEECWNTLEVDWSLFSHSEDMLVEDVPVAPALGDQKDDVDQSGTTIRVSKLSSDWDWNRFNELLAGKIARFIDPFEAGLANKLLVAKHNGRRVLIPSVPKALIQHAHASCHASFRFEKGEPIVEGEIDYREKRERMRIEALGSEVLTTTRNTRKRRAKRGHAAFVETPMSLDSLKNLAGFELEIYWYNRRIVDAIENLSENKTASRKEIARWSGGPMLYRHGFRVLPFGEPHDDWISLDKRAFGSSGFKLNRQQVFGRVKIETPHHYLSEQTNREGLVQSEVSDALKRLVTWVINDEFRSFINEVDDREKLKFRKEQLENNQINRAEKTLREAVTELGDHLDGKYEDELQEVIKTAENLRKESLTVLDRLDEVQRQSAEDREKFVYLAGIGLMTEFVFHELERAVSHTMGVISEAGATQASLTALKEQLQTLYKRIAAFDELTGEKRQTKSRFDLCQLIRDVLSNHEREFSRHGINLKLRLPKDPYMIRAVRGMVIQILENLVVNVAYWLKRQAEYKENFKPELVVIIDDQKHQLIVQDNGPGVPISRKDRIFHPFVTTKPSGMGKGLGLYISRDMAEYHGWSLQTESEPGRLQPNRVNGFVLEMG